MYLYSVGVGVRLRVTHIQMGLAHSIYQMGTDGVITVLVLITMISIIINVYTNFTGIHVILKLQSTFVSVCVPACVQAHMCEFACHHVSVTLCITITVSVCNITNNSNNTKYIYPPWAFWFILGFAVVVDI